MLQEHNLRLCSSFGPSPTVLCTWSRGSNRSQIDHVIMPIIPRFQRPKCKCIEGTSHFSDHRMLVMSVRHRTNETTTGVQQHAEKQFSITANKEHAQYQVSLLTTDPQAKDRYTRTLTNKLRILSTGNNSDPKKHLDMIATSVLDAANTALNRSRSPPTPRRKKAGRTLEGIQKELLADRRNTVLKREYREARKAKAKAYANHQEDKIKLFFEDMDKYPPLDRVRLTFRYLKRHRRQATKGSGTYIPLRNWEEKLQAGASSSDVALLEELIAPPEESGPTLHDIQRISLLLRNSTAAGTDGIRPELIRYGPESLHEHIHKLLQYVWRHNEVPPQMVETIQVPIPKSLRPTDVNEFRRITLCPVIYKIYARYLLEQLEQYLGDVDNYQFAYHQNRGAEDQIFVVRQLLDERWRKGRTTYLVSLDLRQAFDTIDLSVVPSTLQRLGVPAFLANRIVSACLTERTSLQWYGQRTEEYNKIRGIKQGCPLSPKLFVYLLDQALKALQEKMPELFLGYADDILMLATDPSQIPRLLNNIAPCLKEFGLELNVDKTEILIRDPSQPENSEPPHNRRFGRYDLKVVPKLRHLGVYITSTLNRRETVSDRSQKALRAYFAIVAFVKAFKLQWTTTRKIYNSVIAPIILYGLKVTTLTKHNRDRLRDVEQQIVSGLYDASKHDTSEQDLGSEFDLEKALDGRTIIRKIRMARLLYWAHIQRMNESDIVKLAAEYEIPTPFKRGRPCHNWKTCVEQDMSCTNLSVVYLRELAEDGERFKAFAERMLPRLEEEPTDGDYEEDFHGFPDENTSDDEFQGFEPEPYDILE